MYIYIYISNDPRDTQELGLGLANWWSAVTFTQTRLPRRFNLLRSSKESFMLAPLGSPPTSDDRIASNSCHGTRKERKEREDSICESRWAIPLLPPSPLKKYLGNYAESNVESVTARFRAIESGLTRQVMAHDCACLRLIVLHKSWWRVARRGSSMVKLNGDTPCHPCLGIDDRGGGVRCLFRGE